MYDGTGHYRPAVVPVSADTFSTPDNPCTVAPYATYRVGPILKAIPTISRWIFAKSVFTFCWLHSWRCPIWSSRPAWPVAARVIREPYVCIATQSTCQVNTGTTAQVGVRSLLIWNHWLSGSMYWPGRALWSGIYLEPIPWGAENFTGNIPLQERVNLCIMPVFLLVCPVGCHGWHGSPYTSSTDKWL